MVGADAIAQASSILSIVLALLAIWLSVRFYILSTSQVSRVESVTADATRMVAEIRLLTEATTNHQSAMLSDTLADYREHAWRNHGSLPENIDNKFDARFAELKEELLSRTEEIIAPLVATMASANPGKSEPLTGIRSGIMEIVKSAVDESRAVESQRQEWTLKEKVLFVLRDLLSDQQTVPFAELLDHCDAALGPGQSRVQLVKTLRLLASEDFIGLEMPSGWGEPTSVGPLRGERVSSPRADVEHR